jgi:hypothetical protein
MYLSLSQKHDVLVVGRPIVEDFESIREDLERIKRETFRGERDLLCGFSYL